jgi:hypothetical protein
MTWVQNMNLENYSARNLTKIINYINLMSHDIMRKILFIKNQLKAYMTSCNINITYILENIAIAFLVYIYSIDKRM